MRQKIIMLLVYMKCRSSLSYMELKEPSNDERNSIRSRNMSKMDNKMRTIY